MAGCGGDDTGEDEPPDPPQQITTLTPGVESGTQDFGESVALSSGSSTIVVSDSGREYDTGAAYVFERSGDDWRSQQHLVPADAERENNVAESLAVSDDGRTVVVGAPSIGGADETPTERNGSAYVFERSDGGWDQQAKLTAEADSEDLFGISTAISGDSSTLIIADPGRNADAGVAYVFEQSDETWNRQATLTADDGDDQDRFGTGLSISENGSTVAVGAPGEEGPNVTGTGSAYVFEQTDDGWNQQTKLVDNGDGIGRQGSTVSLSNDGGTVVVGADHEGGSNEGIVGFVAVYERSDERWNQTVTFAPETDDNGSIGSLTVSDDGGTTAVGVPDGTPGETNGSAFLFEQSDGEWKRQATVRPQDSDTETVFGWSVAVSGDGTTTVVGAPDGSPPERGGAGVVYVFE
jgi:hypothetical protein